MVAIEDSESSPHYIFPYHNDSEGIQLDIWNLVIDALANDSRSLKACAITCRAFLRRTRYHLFRRNTIRTSYAAERFVYVLQCNPDCGGFVREFTLQASGSAILPESLLPMLPNLRNVSFRGPSLSGSTYARLLSEVRRTVSTLDLTFCAFEEFGHFARLVLALPYIKHLTVNFLSMRPDRALSPTAMFKIPICRASCS